MAVTKFQFNDETYYRVYVQIRGKINSRLRKQKLIKRVVSEKKAKKLEKEWIAKLSHEVASIEGKGLFWEDVVSRWEMAAKYGHIRKHMEPYTIDDHLSRLRRFCAKWKGKVASDLSRANGRDVINKIIQDGGGLSLQKKVKSSINVVFDWAIEEGFIVGQNHSPVFGISLDGENKEKFPPILNLNEVKILLREAKRVDHSFYHVWAFLLLTGMRSGEAWALLWEDVDWIKRIIRVNKSYSKKLLNYKKSKDGIKSTKNGKWRNVPISDHLFEFLREIKRMTGGEKNVLPRIHDWKNGCGAKVLRNFLKHIGINKYVVIHTLRACFATHLMAQGVEPSKVMKVGGWSDYKTFQIYVRLSGIEEKGVTDGLKILPSEGDFISEIPQLYIV